MFQGSAFVDVTSEGNVRSDIIPIALYVGQDLCKKKQKKTWRHELSDRERKRKDTDAEHERLNIFTKSIKDVLEERKAPAERGEVGREPPSQVWASGNKSRADRSR